MFSDRIVVMCYSVVHKLVLSNLWAGVRTCSYFYRC